MSRLLRACLAGALVAAAAPATATAASVAVSGEELVYTAEPGEANLVAIRQSGTTFRVTDVGTTIAPGAGCTAISPQQASCTSPDITLVLATLGNLDDSARFSGAVATRLNGGPGSDVLRGGNGADVLRTDAGSNEQLFGNGGDDQLAAGDSTGDAVLSGGPGDDLLEAAVNAPVPAGANGGYSVLDGGAGRDLLFGKRGNEVLNGGTGPDLLVGGDGFDYAHYRGRNEAVTVTVGAGNADDGGASDEGVIVTTTIRDDIQPDVESVLGGSGNDTLTGSANGESLAGGPGADVLNGGAGGDTLCGEGVESVVNGDPMLSCFSGGTGDDVLNGDAGDDVLTGGPAADEFYGGAGADTVTYGATLRAVSATIADRCGQVTCASDNDGMIDASPNTPGNQPERDFISLDVENLAGTGLNDTLGGSAGDNRLLGGLGRDTLTALAGNDVLCGDREVFFTSQAPVVSQLACDTSFESGPQFADVLDAGDGNDLLFGEKGADQLLGGAHTDTASYANRAPQNGGVTVTIADDCAGTPCGAANDGATDISPGTPGNQSETDTISLDTENVIGTVSGDSLAGSGAPNALTGGDGTDVLQGRAGGDLLDPGGGDGNVVNGEGGVDTVTYRAFPGFDGVSVTLDGVANDGRQDVLGNPVGTDNVAVDVEGVIGSRGGDRIVAQLGAVANVLFGGAGNDEIEASSGNDRVSGDAGADTLRSGPGDDLVSSADGQVDTEIHCGDGTNDTALHDASETPVACETLEPFAAAGLASP